jgi:hypothetical protein
MGTFVWVTLKLIHVAGGRWQLHSWLGSAGLLHQFLTSACGMVQ